LFSPLTFKLNTFNCSSIQVRLSFFLVLANSIFLTVRQFLNENWVMWYSLVCITSAELGRWKVGMPPEVLDLTNLPAYLKPPAEWIASSVRFATLVVQCAKPSRLRDHWRLRP
jgi:hypothetical protein